MSTRAFSVQSTSSSLAVTFITRPVPPLLLLASLTQCCSSECVSYSGRIQQQQLIHFLLYHRPSVNDRVFSREYTVMT